MVGGEECDGAMEGCDGEREECDGLEGSVLNPHVCVLW